LPTFGNSSPFPAIVKLQVEPLDCNHTIRVDSVTGLTIETRLAMIQLTI
jgi:hypothetical protein